MQSDVAASVEECIRSFPAAAQPKLQEMRSLLSQLVPEGEWRISYRMPALFLRGRVVAYFAGFARHIGFYPGARPLEVFGPELGGYKHARGSVQFPLSEPLPHELITRIVAFKVQENSARAG